MPMRSTQLAQEQAHRRFPSPMLLFKRYRKSYVPAGGWTYENFQTENGRAWVRDQIDINRQARLRGIRDLTPRLNKLLASQVERVVEAAVNQYRQVYQVRGKAEVAITVEGHGALWANAIEAEMQAAGLEVVAEVLPTVQSVADDVHGKISLGLGAEPTASQVHSLGVRVRDIGTQISSISNTTRGKIADIAARGIREGQTVYEVAKNIRDSTAKIAYNRVPTIARTEMGRASDTATKHAMKLSGTVSHVGVMGCAHVEVNSPHMDGYPTCNISGVPIHREGELIFHINHMGTIVSEAYYKEDGTAPNISITGAPYTR